MLCLIYIDIKRSEVFMSEFCSLKTKGFSGMYDTNELWSIFNQIKDKRDCEEYKEIRDRLIVHYLPLVKQAADKLSVKAHGVLSQEDLESCGIMGLIEAIDKFDVSFNVKFETFAYHRIRGTMIDELRKTSWVPRLSWQKIQILNQAKEKLQQQGREINENNLVEITGMSEDELKKVMRMPTWHHIGSLDEGVYNHKSDMVYRKDMIEDVNAVDPLEETIKKEDVQMLSDAVESLKERDKLLLALYYQENLTLKEIGKVLGISESRVCQLHAQAINRLRTIVAHKS